MGSSEIYYKPTFMNISEEKRQNILSVAVCEFANHGFDNANINTIAKKAQVSVGSLYKYFDTKTDLFMMSVHYGIASLETVVENVVNSDEDVMLRLEKLIRIAIDYSRKNSLLIKLYNVCTNESNSDIAQKIARDMEGITANAYRQTIAQGQAAGEIRKDIDPGMASFLVDTLLMNIQFSYACDYYSERYKIFAGDDILQRDDFVIENILSFVKSALKPENK